MFKKVIAAGAVLACTTSVVPAATTTTTFNVTATVISSCSTSAANLAFGNYDPLSLVDKLATTNISVTCSLLAPFNVGISIGTNGVSVTDRKMLISGGGTETLDYDLYQDVTHLINWGATVGTDTLASIGTGLSVALPVYGVIPASQNVPVGSYSDTVTVTITY
jgi:spore coat protein U-like protein